MDHVTCPICSEKFSRRDNMKRHLCNTHSSDLKLENAAAMGGAMVTHCPKYISDHPPFATAGFRPTQHAGSQQRLYNTLWKHPFTCMVVGPSQSGKTVFVTNLIKANVIDPAPHRIIWCYSEWQSLYDTMKGVEFVQGLPDLSELRCSSRIRKLIIADDLMNSDEGTFMELATKGVHHWNCSLIFIVQDAFFNKRTTRINSHYLLLFKNPGDRLTAQNLARQSGNVKWFMSAYDNATREPHGYLLFDRTQSCPDEIRLRTSVIPPGPERVYAPMSHIN